MKENAYICARINRKIPDRMELTYIFHSGFVLETQQSILIFDYWLDSADILQQFAHTHKHTYFFSSHFHEDHFNREIFQWRDERHTYILSKDILKHRRAQKEEADVWLAKGGTWEDERIKVLATGSNDSGVSWVVETEGKRIFHAGDLCNWYARFLAEEEVPQTVYSEEFGRIDPVREEKMFLGELKDIARLMQENGMESPSFDLIMFPVDGRIGNGYTLGGRQFIERFKTRLFVPMHFAASGFESSWRMEPFCLEKDIPFWCIRKRGDRVALIDDLLIRPSTVEDIPRMQEIYAHARQFMVETGNPEQWGDSYPSEEFLREDIDNGVSFVCLKGTLMVATFVLQGGDDPTYAKIYEGAWKNEEPYATIHRIASSGEAHGILHKAMKYAVLHYDNVRIDTHRDNIVMQHAILKEGFHYCGIIYCWDGGERLAYQYTKG